MQQNVLNQGRIEAPQKTNDNLGNLRIDKTNIHGVPEAILEQVLCIWYPTNFREKSVLIQEMKLMPYTLSLLRNWASGP